MSAASNSRSASRAHRQCTAGALSESGLPPSFTPSENCRWILAESTGRLPLFFNSLIPAASCKSTRVAHNALRRYIEPLLTRSRVLNLSREHLDELINRPFGILCRNQRCSGMVGRVPLALKLAHGSDLPIELIEP